MGVGRAVDWDCCRERMPGAPSIWGGMWEIEARKGRGLGGGTGESIQCLGMPQRSLYSPLRPMYVWNVKRQENPESFRSQGKLGKGTWSATSKGPRGIPRKLGLCALLMGPEPGVDLSCCLCGPQTKAPNKPSQPKVDLGVWGTGHARESPLVPWDSFFF